MIADSAGNLYGTTILGGDTNCQSGFGCGAVFRLEPDGTESVLYAFQGGSDGWEPWNAGLVVDASGNLYGETLDGGSYDGSNCKNSGCGTVFEVQPDGTKISLHDFQSGNDGDGPAYGLVFDDAGNLYGTTGGGGGSGCDGGGCGVVFKISSNGTETVFYAFQGGVDGAGPVGLTIDAAGDLYGATVEGDDCSVQYYQNECGTIYKLTPDGKKTILYDFQGGNDGMEPRAPLVRDNGGNLYGTTEAGGGIGCGFKKYGTGCGTAFKLARSGVETVLYSFRSHDGRNPQSGLLLGAHKENYGTTPEGGSKGSEGVVFELKK